MEALILISVILNICLFVGILQASDSKAVLRRKISNLELEALNLKRVSILENTRYQAYKLNAVTSEAVLTYTKSLLDRSLRENEEIRQELAQIRLVNENNIVSISDIKSRYIKGN